MRDWDKLIPDSYPNDVCGRACRDYVVECDDYAGIYLFMSYLKNLHGCDYSDAPQDWYRMKNGIIQSHWIIFVSCIPRDMLRMRHVANRFDKYDISIIEDDDIDDMIPFEL